MGVHTLIQRRKYSYVVRKRVPADLVSILGKKEVIRSLHTLNPEEAKRKGRKEAGAIDQMFDEARQGVDLTPQQVTQLANHWLASALDEDAEAREEGERKVVYVEDAAEAEVTREWPTEAAREELAIGDPGTVAFEVEEILQSAGVHNATPQTRRRLSMALLRASVVLQERTAERNQGIWREDTQGFVQAPAPLSPVRPIVARPATTRVTEDNPLLSAVLDRWMAERKPPPRTRIEWNTQHRRFREVVGEDLPVQAITSGHIRAFKDALLRLPNKMPAKLSALPVPEILANVGDDPEVPRLSVEAVNKGLNAISSVLSFAKRNGYLENNPASGIRAEKPAGDQERRLPYEAADLELIFGSEVFRDAPADPRKRNADYWLPLLALYTGARLEELGQALVTDVREEAGHPYLDINTADENKRVKTKGSRRKVPLHPEVIKAGFLEYVAGLREGGERQLFPDLKRDNRGRMTALWSKWWGRYARSIGITDRRKVFHSFRHTFKDACRRADIPEPIHDALTGHSSPSVGRGYGLGYPVEVLAAAVAKIRYDGVVRPA